VKENQDANLKQIIGSVFAAMFGVQSDKNRERDFNATNPKTFIVVGIVFTILFIATIVTVVNVVIA